MRKWWLWLIVAWILGLLLFYAMGPVIIEDSEIVEIW